MAAYLWQAAKRGRSAVVFLMCIGPTFLVSCGSGSLIPVEQKPSAARLASTVYTGDPDAAPQLLSGFYGIEEYSWRWTAQRFSVVLRPPEGGNGEAANLVAQLSVPDVVIQKLHSIALSAAIGGSTLPPQSYTRPGPYTYTRKLAAGLLSSKEIRVDFQLDKVMPPSGQDIRQLGIVLTSVGLEPR